MTRRIRTSERQALSAKEELHGAAQSLLEPDAGLVAEHLACAAAVGPRCADVAGAGRAERSLDRLSEDATDCVGQLVDGHGRSCRDVDDLAAHRRRVRRANGRIDHVGDVREVARLLAVAVDRHRTTLGDVRDEQRDHRRVLRKRALARAEDVEVTKDDALEALVDAREADAVALGGEFRDAVRRQRIGWRRLGHRQLAAGAVDRGARGVHDASHSFVAGREQHVERALDVDGARRQRILHRPRDRPEGAQVEHDLDAAYGVVHAFVAAELSLDDLHVEPFEIVAIAGREVVEHAHVVAAIEQRADEVRADETAAAGDEDACHARTAVTWKLANSDPGTGSRRIDTCESSASASVLSAATTGRAASLMPPRFASRWTKRATSRPSPAAEPAPGVTSSAAHSPLVRNSRASPVCVHRQ